MESTASSWPHLDHRTDLEYTRLDAKRRLRLARRNASPTRSHRSNNSTNKLTPWERWYSKMPCRADYMSCTEAWMESDNALTSRRASSYLPKHSSRTSKNLGIPTYDDARTPREIIPTLRLTPTTSHKMSTRRDTLKLDTPLANAPPSYRSKLLTFPRGERLHDPQPMSPQHC